MKLNDETVHEAELKKSWNRSLSVIRAEIGEATFKSWFRNVEFGELKEDQLVLYVPTRFTDSPGFSTSDVENVKPCPLPYV